MARQEITVDDVAAELRRIHDQATDAGAERAQKQLELQARLSHVEQSLDQTLRYAGGRGRSDPSAGVRRLLTESPEIRAMADGKARRAVVDLPNGVFAAITSTGIVPPAFDPNIVSQGQRALRIRDLIPVVSTTAGSVSYLAENTFANLAAPVAEGDLKPESAIGFELKTAPVVTVAHWIKCSAQVLSDVGQLSAYIDGRLRYGLAFVEELQLLKGSGVGNNLAGIFTQASVFDPLLVTPASPTKIDVLRAGINQLQSSLDFEPTGIVLHPSDWAAIELTKDTMGNYICGAPRGANPPTLWNVPVVISSSMGYGNFLIGDFKQAALLFDREMARVDISTEDQDNFVRNMVTIRAEERLALAVLRPQAMVKGAFVAEPG